MAPRCCGFAALRAILVLLNTVYIGLSLFLVGLVIAARTLAYNFTNIQILIGIGIVAGFLFVVAVLGLIGTLRHNMIIMFFYMILLGLSGVALFAVSVAALSIPRQFQEGIFTTTWQSLSYEKKAYIQEQLDCCGFNNETRNIVALENSTECFLGHPQCNTKVLLENCCKGENGTKLRQEGECLRPETLICHNCDPCYNKWEDSVGKGLKLAGGLGLIFSLTQIAGIVLTFRYRNLKDPSVNPGDYL